MEKKINKILVMGNMSSGKSTFINTILKNEILPTSNLACTSKEFKLIIDNSRKTYSYYIDGKRKSLKFNGLEKIKFLNQDKDINEIIIKGPSILPNLNMCEIYDSPGPNNSVDITHKNITFNMLKNKKFNKIIFLLNAGNLFTVDDKTSLEELVKLGYGVESEITIVVNKIDKIHISDEADDIEIINKTNDFLTSLGIKKNKIYLYSSLYFILKNKKEKNRSEKRILLLLEEIYNSKKVREFKNFRREIFS